MAGFGLSVLCLACRLTAGSLFGQTQGQRKELLRIQAELDKAKVEIEESRGQEEALIRDSQKLETRGEETRKRLCVLRQNIRRFEEGRAELKGRLSALSRASGFWASAFSAQMSAYAHLRAGFDETWSGRELSLEVLRRMALLDKARLLSALHGKRLKTEAAAEAASLKAARLKGASRRVEIEVREVLEEHDRKQAAAAQARERLVAAQKKAKELEDTKLALTHLLSRIGAAQPGLPARLDIPAHSLPWPVEGSVERPFGRERNPELNAWVIHQGTTFATKVGAPVGAVDAGRVIFAGPFRSHGNVVILDHGDGFFSVYGSLGQILKTKGAAVGSQDTIGTAGGSQGRGILYLELRRGTQALDPLMWLRKK